jgi:putative transposase
MRIFNKFAGTKGFISAWERMIRFKYMITEKAKRKVRILAFWEKHGLDATKDAFHVSKATLYRWSKNLKSGNGKLDSLNDKSKTPHTKRRRIVDDRIINFIINQRSIHPRLSKDKLAELLKSDCLAWQIKRPSASTVGRIMAELKQRNLLPKYFRISLSAKTGRMIEKTKVKRKKLRRGGYMPQTAGSLVQIDTVVKFINGLRRFIVTAIDVKSDFAFAYGYLSLSSATATDFMIKLERVAPFKITHVQTDNGLEFERYFREYLEKNSIVHFHNYPKSPKMNAYVERFNRTIQEEFANRYLLDLRDNLELFNKKLIDWLLWYNTGRPHWSLGLISPVQYLVNQLTAPESHMLWTDTFIGFLRKIKL